LQHETQEPLTGSQHPPARPQSASVVQAHAPEPHFLVTAPQHWPARQSPFDRQHGAHVPPMQHVPGPQSVSAQHAAHAPFGQHWPRVHGAEGPHGQSDDPH
jgi:hypothetical protein